MAPIEDHVYLKICAELANCLSISIASARRKVDLASAREGVRALEARKAIAQRLLDIARSNDLKNEETSAAKFDQLLEALAEDDNFMIED